MSTTSVALWSGRRQLLGANFLLMMIANPESESDATDAALHNRELREINPLALDLGYWPWRTTFGIPSLRSRKSKTK